MSFFLRLGMPSLIELESLEEHLNHCHELGLNLIELNMDLPRFQTDKLRSLPLVDDIEFSLHLPEMLNVWDFDNKIRSAYSCLMEDIVEAALSKKITILNMHMNPGVYFTLPHTIVYLFEKHGNFYRDQTAVFAEKMSRILKGTDIRIHIENTGDFDKAFIVEGVAILLEKSCFSLTWDLGHDCKSGFKDRAFMHNHLKQVSHLHLHDCMGKSDHLPLGEGTLEWKEIFQQLKPGLGSVILETKTLEGVKKSIQYFRQYSGVNGFE